MKSRGWAVAGKNDLFAVLLQVIEDVEESILRLHFAYELLHIVHNQYVYTLVEVHEIVEGVVYTTVGELYLKKMCT